jgi:TatD DNase family protein
VTRPLYVDSHCHVDRYADRRRALDEAANAGVVTVAVTEMPSAFQRQHARLRQIASARIAIGMHPLAVARATPMELSLFRRLIDRTDYVGEVGLDFSREGAATKALQIKTFRGAAFAPGYPKQGPYGAFARRRERCHRAAPGG